MVQKFNIFRSRSSKRNFSQNLRYSNFFKILIGCLNFFCQSDCYCDFTLNVRYGIEPRFQLYLSDVPSWCFSIEMQLLLQVLWLALTNLKLAHLHHAKTPRFRVRLGHLVSKNIILCLQMASLTLNVAFLSSCKRVIRDLFQHSIAATLTILWNWFMRLALGFTESITWLPSSAYLPTLAAIHFVSHIVKATKMSVFIFVKSSKVTQKWNTQRKV